MKRIVHLLLVVSVLLVGCVDVMPTEEKQVEIQNKKVDQGIKEDNKINKAYIIRSEYEAILEKNMQLEIQYPVIEKMKNKNIEEKINYLIKEKVENYKKKLSTGISMYIDFGIMVRKEERLSLKFIISTYKKDGSYLRNEIDAINFNLENGTIYTLKDLFEENEAYIEKLNTLLSQKIKKLEYPLLVKFKGIEDHQGYYLKEEGLVVYYQEGIYTPYQIGPLELEISFAELGEILKK